MAEANIDAATFHKRLSIIQKNLVHDAVNQILIVVGVDDNTYKKSTVIQTWLLGYEFQHTAIYITQDKCVFLTSEGKAKYLKQLPNKPTANSSEVEIWTRTKDADKNKKLFEQLIAQLKCVSDGVYGSVVKDQYEGKFVKEWQEASKDQGLKQEDITLLVSKCMELKDSEEFANTSIAARSSTAMMETLVDDMSLIVDQEKKISNSEFANKIEDKVEDDSLRYKWFGKSDAGKKLAQSKDFDADLLEWCYSPIVQSGGEYDLKASAESSDSQLVGDGVILASLGLRFKSYCSNVGRTFLIDPSAEVEANYDFLLKLQSHITTTLIKDGVPANKVYQGAIDYIKAERPELVNHFTKNCGWLLGIEFRDSTFILNAKNERKLQNGHIISLTIGFSNLVNSKARNPKLKQYALLLTDTFKVSESEPILLTNYTKNRAEISFYFNEEPVKAENSSANENKPKPKNVKNERQLTVNEANSKILKQKFRHEAGENDDNPEKARQEQQLRLHEKRLQEGLARFSKADATDSSDLKPVFKKYESYVRESQIPSGVKDLKIHIDYKNQTIILPICGRPVPFHINSFKSGSQNEEGEFTYLRLNFNSPGAGGNTSRRTELPYEDAPDNSFVRSITLRSRDRERMVQVFKSIQELKKDSVKREQEKKQMADVVSQANLIELKGSRVKKLELVFIRPTPDTKKLGGVLQIHENGLRYQSSFKNDQRVDVLFSNIKHLFFQPCKDELIVIIHCHLKSPIMIGKKKTHDVQFYREASDMAFDETGGRKRKYRYGDEDELQQEQEERRRKVLLDKEFKAFAELIADSSNGLVDVDVPFRDLGFLGVPFRSSVLCMPTRDCLIQLIDPPYLVVTLEEIELAHLERVQFGLKNFDLVFVFKDFSRPPVHINTIPMELLEDVKSWLTNVDIPYSEGQMNLNWGAIIKTVLQDPYQFFADGGWKILTGEGDSDDEEEESEESEFEVTDDDPSDEDVDSAGSEDDYSLGGGSDSGSGSGSDESEEEGEDWDEMEKKAAREDKRFGRE
ncbi:FACT complex subunit SPT16 [Suhomyces tanzawaensis NRRL Y-17324]|uniref:FACT complex subunit n=1 Tax=Suhomyces tanzawaensis NRRL Y-17324 TaxID=984487 RepID=A0A1E4SFB1_9ASCO|nr:FACT complex subunit SPT16 [Suhomyces tanzawaensis NRRL Y-17324]ODV78217.1 FACT complex subunit SPT16 [Suhomyces tanzawaensis NRRL Y-17324]